jgi:hypothetical protein
MAPPPKYLVTRKLVRHFLKKYIPTTPEGVKVDSNSLFECWVGTLLKINIYQNLRENMTQCILFACRWKKNYQQQ